MRQGGRKIPKGEMAVDDREQTGCVNGSDHVQLLPTRSNGEAAQANLPVSSGRPLGELERFHLCFPVGLARALRPERASTAQI